MVLTVVVFRVAVFSPAVATGAVIALRIAIVGATATAASATTPATPAALIAITATVGSGDVLLSLTRVLGSLWGTATVGATG